MTKSDDKTLSLEVSYSEMTKECLKFEACRLVIGVIAFLAKDFYLEKLSF